MLKLDTAAESAMHINSRSSRHLQRTHYWLVAVLLLLYVGQCVWFIRTQSFTWDEPLHIAAGVDAWRHGKFEQTLDHPPLGHLLPTIPIAHGRWNIVQNDEHSGICILSITPDAVAMATRTRMVNVLLGVILGLLLWFTAKKLFSRGAADVALALFAFSPSLITHFSLVTTDGVATLTLFAAGAQFLRWREHPSWRQTTLLGVVLGLLLLSKLSTSPLFLLTLGLMLVTRPYGWSWSPRRWNWGRALAAAYIALMLLWAGYFFHVSRITIHNHILTETFPNRSPLVLHTNIKRDTSIVVPAGEYFEGIRQILLHNKAGQPAFLLGKIKSHSTVVFTPVVALLKWPLIVVLLFTCSMVLFLTKRLHSPPGAIVLMLFPALYWLVIMRARVAVGERHFLPVYPFVLLIACATWEFVVATAIKKSIVTRRAWIVVLVAALLLNAMDTLQYGPGYLSYLSVFAAGKKNYDVLGDSNLDWGQGLLALRDYQSQHPTEKIHLAYFGSVDPKIYGIQFQTLQPQDRPSGTIVISATNLSGQYLAEPRAYEWVTRYPLKAVLDHCLFVFSVPARHDDQPGVTK